MPSHYASIQGRSDEVPISDPLMEYCAETSFSNICRHSYSRLGIEGIFNNAKRNKRSARCPVAGCNVELTKDNLIVGRIGLRPGNVEADLICFAE